MVHRKAMARPELDHLLRKRLTNIKNSMIQRCYDENHKKFKNYGGRGVTVDKKWHRLKGFLEDFDSIDGWDEEEFLNRRLQLDKDTKILGNKVYSKETCQWISPEENIKVKPSYQNKYIGVRIDGYKESFFNIEEFCKKYPDVHRTAVKPVAEGKKAFSAGWYVYFEGDDPKPPWVYIARKDGEEKLSFKQSELERELSPNCSVGTIYNIVNGKRRDNTIEGWVINRYRLPC